MNENGKLVRVRGTFRRASIIRRKQNLCDLGPVVQESAERKGSLLGCRRGSRRKGNCVHLEMRFAYRYRTYEIKDRRIVRHPLDGVVSRQKGMR